MAIVSKALICMAIVLVTVLFASLYDIGNLGLREMVSPLAIILIVLFTTCSIVPVFLKTGVATNEALNGEGLNAKIEEVRTKAASRMAALQSTLDGLSGQDNDALIEENKNLKEQLEAIQQEERDKVLNNAEELKLRNEELENQIKQWAIETVKITISEDRVSQAKVA